MRDKTVLGQISVQLAIVDATGRSWITTTTANAPANVNVADREHFRVQATATVDRLFISKPVVARDTGEAQFSFAPNNHPGRAVRRRRGRIARPEGARRVPGMTTGNRKPSAGASRCWSGATASFGRRGPTSR